MSSATLDISEKGVIIVIIKGAGHCSGGRSLKLEILVETPLTVMVGGYFLPLLIRTISETRAMIIVQNKNSSSYVTILVLAPFHRVVNNLAAFLITAVFYHNKSCRSSICFAKELIL